MSNNPINQRNKMARWSLNFSIILCFVSLGLILGSLLTVPPLSYLILGFYLIPALLVLILGILGLDSYERNKAVTSIGLLVFVTLMFVFLVSVTTGESPEREKFVKLENDLTSVCSREGNPNTNVFDQNTNTPHIIGIDPYGKYATNRFVPLEYRTETLEDVELVLCIWVEREEKIQTCRYENGKTLDRYQYNRSVRLHKALDGKEIAEGTIIGEKPEPCPAVVANAITSASYGGHPGLREIDTWLKEEVFKQK